jgi:polysaccharide biosynthesis/export protein
MFRISSRIGVMAIILCLATGASAQSTVPEGALPRPVPLPSESTSANQAAAAATSQSKQTSSNGPTLFTRSKANAELRIGGGDLLQIGVFGAPDYTHDVRVAEDGSISLPLLGQVRVAGLTPRELASDLRMRFTRGGYFNDPQVTVFVKEYATQGVSVLGEVQKPGVYPLLGARTLFDVLSAAQGTTQTAGDKVFITHRGATQPEVVRLAYDVKGAAQSNVPVLPGDTIIVAKAAMVYVVGNVQKPAGIVMVDPGLTVLKAIALAQGIAPNAALDRAKLVRKTGDGQTAIPLNLKKMLAAKAPDMPLQADDVVFVPNSLSASAFKRGLEIALQTTSGVIIYRR